MKKFDAFGTRVREAQDATLRGAAGERTLREARTLWLSTPSGSKAARGVARRRPWIAATSVLAAAACVLFLAFTARLFAPVDRAAPLTFQVGPSETPLASAKGTAAPGVPGQWVAAATAERLPLRFSEGSLVRLEASARARVVDVTDTGARVALESGTVHAEIVHRDKTRWSIEAGPFEVRVTGTQFDVAWDPSPRQLTISLLEGRVAVSGCDLAHPRVVAAGETFQATCHDDRANVDGPTPAPLPTPVRPTEAPPTVAPRPSHAASATPPAAATNAGFAPPDSPTWREVLARGRYAEALRLAEEEGLSSVCASADVGTLMQLGDAARFAGRADRAKVILLEVRRRFPGDSRAATAGFHLGRIAFDDDASFADAARWFDRYLTELPAGPLAREASGRRMEALEKSGDHAGAALAAKGYLEAFPTGPHAQLARSIDTR
jgi:ferric-dicitrate binding protein FerR (iron transport regulator)